MADSGEQPAHASRLRVAAVVKAALLDITLTQVQGGVPITHLVQAAGRLNREVLTMATGPGKSVLVLGNVIHQLLDAERKRSSVYQQIVAQQNYGLTADELSERLHASLEADTGLPGITSNLKRRQPRLRTVDACQCVEPSLQTQEAALSRWIVRLHDLLGLLLGTTHYEFTDTGPRLETSPCGVIRLAAPRVPRAPTVDGDPLAPLHMRAPAT